MHCARILAGIAITVAMAVSVQAQTALPVDAYIDATFKKVSPEWKARIVPDETLKLCSETRGQLSATDSKRLMEAAAASIVYPADGKVIGDWKKGEALAQRGTGGQFSDKPETPKGANCYACHQLAAKELSFGTLGPSLLHYGKDRKYAAQDAKAAYAKIYNAHAVQPCSNMPRFGHNKFLTIDEMKDLTAYLFDPESPVNK